MGQQKITKFSKYSQQNYSEIVTSEDDKETTTERYISSEKIHKIIDNLRTVIIV